jgi:hypothetical protein
LHLEANADSLASHPLEEENDEQRLKALREKIQTAGLSSHDFLRNILATYS